MSLVNLIKAIPGEVKLPVDATSISVGVLAISDYITGVGGAIAVILSIIWTLIRLYEMQTIQTWLKKRKEK